VKPKLTVDHAVAGYRVEAADFELPPCEECSGHGSLSRVAGLRARFGGFFEQERHGPDGRVAPPTALAVEVADGFGQAGQLTRGQGGSAHERTATARTSVACLQRCAAT
jgi:hypothetical protein